MDGLAQVWAANPPALALPRPASWSHRPGVSGRHRAAPCLTHLGTGLIPSRDPPEATGALVARDSSTLLFHFSPGDLTSQSPEAGIRKTKGEGTKGEGPISPKLSCDMHDPERRLAKLFMPLARETHTPQLWLVVGEHCGLGQRFTHSVPIC